MRRRIILAGAIAAGVAAGVYRFTGLFVHHYPATPYDDLLSRLVDRDAAAKLGAQLPGPFDVAAEARGLRSQLRSRTLGDVAGSDIAAGRMVEVKGWLLPQSIVRLCALAADVQRAGVQRADIQHARAKT